MIILLLSLTPLMCLISFIYFIMIHYPYISGITSLDHGGWHAWCVLSLCFQETYWKFLKLCPSKTQGILLSSWPLEDTYKLTHTVLSAVIPNLPQDLEPQFLSVTFLHLQNQTMVLLLYFQVSVTRASLVILVSAFLGWPWRNTVQFLQ